MAILCSPVSSQLDGGEGHREVQARSALCVAARCGQERSQGARCTRWAGRLATLHVWGRRVRTVPRGSGGTGQCGRSAATS